MKRKTSRRPAPRPSEAQRLLMQLLDIPGRSGHETAVARFVTDRLVEAGVSRSAITHDAAHRKSLIGGEIGNLIVKLPGTGATKRAPRRLFMAHMDTVPLCLGARPIKRGGRIIAADPTTALGADDRSGTAVVLAAALDLIRSGDDHPPLTLLWTVQEEFGLQGSRHLNVAKLGEVAMGFNFDGGYPQELVLGATGAFRMTIKIRGIPAHAGVHPERGASAVAIAAVAMAQLQRDGWHGLIVKGRSRGTSNFGAIEGGAATNVVAESLTLKAEARSHEPRFRRQIVEAYRKAFEQAVAAIRTDDGRTGQVTFEVRDDYESFALKRDAAVVRTAAAALEAQGIEPVYRIMNGGLDANWLNAYSCPTVTLGTGQHSIHTTDEFVELAEFDTACAIARRLIRGG